MGGMRRPKKWVVALLVIGGTLVCAGLLVGFWTGIGPYDLPPKSRQLEDVIAVSKSLGLPMTQAELVGEIPPDDQNAAPGVNEIVKALRFPSSAALNARPGADAELLAEQAKWIGENEVQLDRLVAALRERQGWHVKRDYDMGLFLLFPEYARLKAVVKVLSARGILRTRKGDVDGALSDLAAATDLSARASTEPTLIALLVSIAIESITVRSVEHYVNAWQGNAPALAKLERTLTDSVHHKDPRIALRGEFYVHLSFCRNFKTFGGLESLSNFDQPGESGVPKVEPTNLKRSGLPSGLFERASLSTMAKHWNEVFATYFAGDRDERGWGAHMERVGRHMEERIRLSEVLAMIMMPVYDQTEDALMNDAAVQQLTVAFVRCMRFRAENKRWPKSLGEVGADFSDPFNDNLPIKAKFGPNELRVWSVGRDRVDDGGKIRVKGEKGEDTVFVWPQSLRPTPQ